MTPVNASADIKPRRLTWRWTLVVAVAAVATQYCSGETTGPTPPPPPPGGNVSVLVGAGDIAECGSAGTVATAQLLDRMFGTVFTAGDNVYHTGSPAEFLNCYEPTWGRQKYRTKPVPGNHDYATPNASGYFSYFAAAAAPEGLPYYAYTVGSWTVFALNSEIPSNASSEQVTWLRLQLASTPAKCVAAIFHRPLFTSGPNADNPDMRDLWRTLYEFNVDLIINGHDHLYERFAPQDPTGKRDDLKGIKEFIVGTGGAALYPAGPAHTNSEVRASFFGVISFTLQETGYQWQFVPAKTGEFTDSGTWSCH